MTRDKKIALFIAPFLLIGGYIAADYYAEYKAAEQAREKKLYQLSLQGSCDIINNSCLLSNDTLRLELTDNQGMTSLKSSVPLDSVVFSYLDPATQNTSKQEQRYQFSQGVDNRQWEQATRLSVDSEKISVLTLRLIVTVDSAYYFAEFMTNGQVSEHGN